MSYHVVQNGILVCTLEWTHSTLKGTLSCMTTDMSLQVVLCYSRVRTVWARKWFFACMCAHVVSQVCGYICTVWTVGAHMLLSDSIVVILSSRCTSSATHPTGCVQPYLLGTPILLTDRNHYRCVKYESKHTHAHITTNKQITQSILNILFHYRIHASLR